MTSRYGTVQAAAWARLHQKLTSRVGWEDHDGPLPVIEGTLIRLHVTSHLPGYRALEPMWLWSSPPGRLTPARVRHGFRSIRQTLPTLASAPKPGKPGPGRPPGSKNRHPATRHVPERGENRRH